MTSLGIGAAIAWGIVALLAAGAIIADRIGRRRLATARTWPSVTGTIVDALIISSSQNIRPQISYTYALSGRGYASDRVYPSGTPVFIRPAKAQALVARFVPGQPVAISYNPADPADAAIALGMTNPTRAVFLVMCATAMLIALALTIVI